MVKRVSRIVEILKILPSKVLMSCKEEITLNYGILEAITNKINELNSSMHSNT